MTTYARLTPTGTLDILHGIPHVSNPSPETLKTYAEAHGYKPIVRTASPGTYYTASYKETAKQIRQQWTPWALEDAKADALARVQNTLDTALATTTTIPCDGIPAGIVYNQDACLNAIGMQAAGSWPAFIDAANNLHNLDASAVAAVAHALTTYRASLYTTATTARTAIAAAENVDAVAAALDPIKS